MRGDNERRGHLRVVSFNDIHTKGAPFRRVLKSVVDNGAGEIHTHEVELNVSNIGTSIKTHRYAIVFGNEGDSRILSIEEKEYRFPDGTVVWKSRWTSES